jgi:hypothetical protein
MDLFEIIGSLPFLPTTVRGCLATVVGILVGVIALAVFLWFWDPSERSCGLFAIGVMAFSALLFITLLAAVGRHPHDGA